MPEETDLDRYGIKASVCATRNFRVFALDPDIAGAFPDIDEPFSLYLGANYANHPMPFTVPTAEQSNAVAVSLIHDFNLGEYKARNTRQNINQEINAIVGDDDRVTYLQEQLEPNALRSFLNVTARAIFAILRKPSEAAIIESLNDVEVQRYITSVNTAQSFVVTSSTPMISGFLAFLSGLLNSAVQPDLARNRTKVLSTEPNAFTALWYKCKCSTYNAITSSPAAMDGSA
ncbi:Ff.00g090020.m01.CDS01 [Fusarium sp. VM40]|nr:Ff.00g090020.m01.CDS01 [Fusarium sp. VM40]